MNILFEQIKQETFLFTDEQINNKINQLNDTNTHPITALYIISNLYRDKGFLTKDEYTSEVIYYLYTNSTDSKNKIDSVINENKNWFYDQYDEANNGNIPFNHAIQCTRSALMSFLHEKEFPIDDDLEDLEDDVSN